MQRNIVIGLLVSLSFSAFGQKDATQLKYAETITAADLRSRLEIIASDDFEGRETGQPGQKKAAKYIQERFEEFGFKPIEKLGGYQQEFKLQLTYPDTEFKLIVGVDTLKFLKDMYYFPGFGDMLLQTKGLMYLGYGIDDEKYNDYNGQEVAGRVLMISGDEPVNKKGISYLTGTKDFSDWTVDWTKKIDLAREKPRRFWLLTTTSRLPLPSSVVTSNDQTLSLEMSRARRVIFL